MAAVSAYTPAYGTYRQNVDNSTYSNADMIHTTHFHLDWLVDFDNKELKGAVYHDLDVLADTDWLTMDAWNIDIESVEMVPAGSAKKLRDESPSSLDTAIYGYPLDWEINVINTLIGDELMISFKDVQNAGEEVSVRINYTTLKTA